MYCINSLPYRVGGLMSRRWNYNITSVCTKKGWVLQKKVEQMVTELDKTDPNIVCEIGKSYLLCVFSSSDFFVSNCTNKFSISKHSKREFANLSMTSFGLITNTRLIASLELENFGWTSTINISGILFSNQTISYFGAKVTRIFQLYF